MRTVVAVVAILLVGPVRADEPLTLKDDELAVLADHTSPDRWKLLDRYAGKIVKLEGRVFYRRPGGGAKGGPDPDRGFHLTVPGKPERTVQLQWSDDPAEQKVRDRIAKPGVVGRTPKDKPVDTSEKLTVYGRLDKGNAIGLTDRLVVADAATDPKIGGVPYKPKAKEPAKLKD